MPQMTPDDPEGTSSSFRLWRDHLIGMVVVTATVTTFFALRWYAKLTSGTKVILEDCKSAAACVVCIGAPS